MDNFYRYAKTIGLSVFLVAILLAALVVLMPAAPAVSQGTGTCVEMEVIVDGTPELLQSAGCEDPDPTPVATSTATPEPTATDAPPTLTLEPTVTPTQTVLIEPYPDAPMCPDAIEGHDKLSHHGLWDAERGCYHVHVHGDDPHELDGKLGTRIYAWLGGEISAPWQTGSEEGGWENDLKHAGYIWHVRSDIPCPTSDPCISDFRVLVHQHTLADASVRFHSCSFEGATSNGGYFFVGGHCDFGDLHVPEGTRVIDVAGNHCGSTDNPGAHRQHAIEGGSRAPSNIWYGRTRTNSDVTVDRSCGFASIGVSAQDPWIWSSQEEPYQGDYVCYPNSRCRVNATEFRPHLIGLNIVDDFPFIFDENGVANFAGWSDRYGVPYEDGQSGCVEPSLDCVPFVLHNMDQQQYRTNDSHTALSYRDYDIYFCDGVLCDRRSSGAVTAGWAQPVD